MSLDLNHIHHSELELVPELSESFNIDNFTDTENESIL